MRRCAFLTMKNPGDFVIDDELACAPLAARGWSVDSLPWNAGHTDWSRYELELELVEPALYLRMHERAASNFARAIDERMRGLDIL